MPYTSKSEIDDYLGTVLPNTLTEQLNKWITAVQEWIDKYVGFDFENEIASDKYFDGLGGKELLVDKYRDIVSITTLDVDGDDNVSVAVDTIAEYPLNKNPKDRIMLLSNASIGKWPRGEYSVKINAIWGYSETAPEEIRLCATRLMAHLLNNRLKGGDNVKSESLGDYSIGYGDIDEASNLLGITNILDQYRNLGI